MINLHDIENRSLNGTAPDRAESLEILNYPDEDLLLLLHSAYRVRRKFKGNRVQVQMLMNAKSGDCTEDCRYCSQSCVSEAEIERYPLRSREIIIEGARRSYAGSAVRYCMAMSGISYTDDVISTLAEIIKDIKGEIKISICCSLGFLTEHQASMLKHAGLDRINHNLNTSSEYYKNICTTHSYSDRIANIKLCREAGLEICSGGIIGMGESRDDVVTMLLDLRELDPESIPLNFLIPVKGTPFENLGMELTPAYCLKVLCLARFIHPDKDIRVAGGREYRLGSMQPLALYPANSIFVSGYLTTGGQPVGEGIKMIKDAGFEIEIEGSD